jgi:hypothetical protein
MEISKFDLIKDSGTIRAEALITWEESDRRPFRFFVQTVDTYQDFIWPDPNSFLIASLLVAWNSGESRILIHESLCPVLVNNLEGVFMMLKSWYPNDFGPPPMIETMKSIKASLPVGKGAISLMSGGIDSLCLLRANKLNFPDNHPNAIRAILPIDQTEFPAKDDNELRKIFEGRMKALKPVALDAAVDIIPACTNMWWLNPDGYFYGQKSYSSLLSAITSMFGEGFHKGYIASSYDAAFSAKPWGSHPQLDAYYSTSHFHMENSGTEMTRFRKVKLVADWPVAFQNIRVCQNDDSGSTNCGTCEKCIRTLLMLEAIGKLRECKAFPRNQIDVELVNYLEKYDMLYSTDILHNDEKLYMYGMLIPYLEKRKRHDLVNALKKILNTLREKQ